MEEKSGVGEDIQPRTIAGRAAAAKPANLTIRSGGRARGDFRRQAHAKTRAGTRSVEQFNRAPHPLGRDLGDAQAEPHAAGRAGAGGIDAIEAFKHLLAVRRRHPWTLVPNFDRSGQAQLVGPGVPADLRL